jgi:hypothetical protein
MIPYLEQQAQEPSEDDYEYDYMKQHRMLMKRVVKVLKSLEAAGALG